MEKIVKEIICPRCGNKNFLMGAHRDAIITIKCSECGTRMRVRALPDGKVYIMDVF